MKSQKLSSGPVATGQCLCGAVQFEMEYPAFWAWHDHRRASRLAHGAVYARGSGAFWKSASVLLVTAIPSPFPPFGH